MIFTNKQTYDFAFKDLQKALEWAKGRNVWAIKTPVCVLTLMDPEEFENVSSAVFDGPCDDGASYAND